MSVTSNGKHAKSIVKPITNLVNSSHVEIKIITGRTHQIRVHISFLNHPIIGDKLYGYRKNIFSKHPDLLNHIDPTFGQYLHAYSLSFRDNISGRMKSFQCNYPAKYKSLLEKYGIFIMITSYKIDWKVPSNIEFFISTNQSGLVKKNLNMQISH